MRIALWDIDPFSDALEDLAELGWDTRLASPAECGRLLLDENVDIALVPSIEVLQNTSAFTVLPNVAFASVRRFPFVSLSLDRPLNEIKTIHCAKDEVPFYPLAALVLREQYECLTSIVHEGGADSVLHFGRALGEVDDRRRIDVGTEWFEMTSTPLAWGFFTVRPGTRPDASLIAIQEKLVSLVHGAGSAQGANGSVGDVSESTMRSGYDPEVAEGLDELAHYLFYLGVLDDIPALRMLASER